jgi:hypothetical protein
LVIVRLFGLLAIIAFASSLVVYLVTSDRRFLRVAGRIFRFSLVFFAVVGVLYVLERLILI